MQRHERAGEDAATAGATVYAPDLRGHGSSGRRGDIDYIGQLDDDLADLIATIRPQHANVALTLIGFSAGGAFTIRIAGGPHGDLHRVPVDPGATRGSSMKTVQDQTR